MSSPLALSGACKRPHLAVLALLALGAAGCSSDTTRFASNTPPADITGSVGSSAAAGPVASRPLPPIGHIASVPPPTRPASGVAGGGRGMASYRPGDVTGSVAAHTRQWDWNGGTPITVRNGETLAALSRRYGVPVAAIMQANGMTSASQLRAGQRLVIPRHKGSGLATSGPPATRTAARDTASAADGTHVIKPGETLSSIARRYRVSLAELAKANHIEPYARIKMGDRLVIPGQSAAARRPARTAAKHSAAPEKVAAVEPAQTARTVTPHALDQKPGLTKSSALSFRWPVRGRIIAGFGPKPNGQQNDGINLAVPEGTPIKAAADGVVAYAGNELKSYGNLVLIRHGNGFVTAYAHARELLVKRGDHIKRGQVIARAGETGNVTSPQLHFEIRKGSSAVDPMQYLSGA
jgi:murein DD-endopeptidase MepM/ murein hydrolase activator NlpD